MATNIISMNRGDTLKFNFTIDDGNGSYVLQDHDALYFGVMDPNQMFENALIKKKYTIDDININDPDGTITITIDPEDTIDLLPGRYYYMIKLKMDHDILLDSGEMQHEDSVTTIINKTIFYVYD